LGYYRLFCSFHHPFSQQERDDQAESKKERNQERDQKETWEIKSERERERERESLGLWRLKVVAPPCCYVRHCPTEERERERESRSQ